MKPTNEKLHQRARAIVAELGQVEVEQAGRLLERCEFHIKTAVVCGRRGCDPVAARRQLDAVGGVLTRLEGF